MKTCVTAQQQLQQSYKDHQVAAGYVQQRFSDELNRLLHERQVAVVNRVAKRLTSGRILEIAPGPARVTRDVRHSGLVVCLEYNQSMIDVGRQAGQVAKEWQNTCPLWIRGDAFALPFRQCFDFVYTFRFIRHFHYQDRARLYAEISRVLRPGGWLVFDAVNERVSRPLREAYPEHYTLYDKLYRDVAELRCELAGAGFELADIEPVQRWYRAQYRVQVLLGPRSRRLCRLLIRALELMRRAPALEWIVTCRRT